MEKKGYRKKEAEGRGVLSFVRIALRLSPIDHKANSDICSLGSTDPPVSRLAWFLVMAFNPHLEWPSQVPGYPDLCFRLPEQWLREPSLNLAKGRAFFYVKLERRWLARGSLLRHLSCMLGEGRGVQAHSPLCSREGATGHMIEFPCAPSKLPLLARNGEGAGAVNTPM